MMCILQDLCIRNGLTCPYGVGQGKYFTLSVFCANFSLIYGGIYTTLFSCDRRECGSSTYSILAQKYWFLQGELWMIFLFSLATGENHMKPDKLNDQILKLDKLISTE